MCEVDLQRFEGKGIALQIKTRRRRLSPIKKQFLLNRRILRENSMTELQAIAETDINIRKWANLSLCLARLQVTRIIERR